MSSNALLIRRRTKLVRWALPIALFAAATSLASTAQSADPPKVLSTDEVRALLEKGSAAMQAGKFDEAEAAYRAAWDARPDYDIGANLGQAEFQLKKYRDAAEHLAFSVRTFPASEDPAKRKAVADLLEQAKGHVGALAVSVHEGAAVKVDGHAAGQAPLKDAVFVEPGHHLLVATLAGYEDGQQDVDVGAGQSRDVRISLEPKSSGINWAVGGTGLALGGAAVIAAIALRVVANGKSSDAEGLSAGLGDSSCFAPRAAVAQACSDLHDALVEKDRLANAALGTGVAGGVILAGTLVYVAVAAASGQGAQSAVVPLPWVGPRTAGLQISGSF